MLISGIRNLLIGKGGGHGDRQEDSAESQLLADDTTTACKGGGGPPKYEDIYSAPFYPMLVEFDTSTCTHCLPLLKQYQPRFLADPAPLLPATTAELHLTASHYEHFLPARWATTVRRLRRLQGAFAIPRLRPPLAV